MLRVRNLVPSDRPLLMAAAEADPYHKQAGLTGEHWMGSDSILYEDEFGPVAAIKTTNVVRMDIQFCTQDKGRNAAGLLEGFWTMIRILAQRGVKEIIFNTESQDVAHFFKKRFNFRELRPGNYSLRIK